MRERLATRLGAAVGGGDVVRGVAEEAGQAEAPRAARVRGSRDRGRWVALGVLVVLAAGAVAAWGAGVFSPAATSGAAPGAAAPTTSLVTRQELSATTPVTATL